MSKKLYRYNPSLGRPDVSPYAMMISDKDGGYVKFEDIKHLLPLAVEKKPKKFQIKVDDVEGSHKWRIQCPGCWGSTYVYKKPKKGDLIECDHCTKTIEIIK